MTNDEATKIAAMCAELGKLRAGLRTEPEADQMRIMQGICTSKQATDALHLALGVAIECADNPVAALADQMLAIAGILAPLHEKYPDGREYSRGDVLRKLATACDQVDALRSRFDALMDKLFGPRVPTPDEVDGSGKPGAN